MNVQITARHTKASQKLKDSLTEEVAKLEKYTDGITSCHVILDSEHVDKTVEIVLGVRRGRVNAKAHSDNFGKAIDMALDKIKTQLKKVNQKRKEHKGIKDVREARAARDAKDVE